MSTTSSWNQFLAYRAFKGLLRVVFGRAPKALIAAHQEIDARSRRGLVEKAAAQAAEERTAVEAAQDLPAASPPTRPQPPLDPANLVVVCIRELADPVARLSVTSGRPDLDGSRPEYVISFWFDPALEPDKLERKLTEQEIAERMKWNLTRPPNDLVPAHGPDRRELFLDFCYHCEWRGQLLELRLLTDTAQLDDIRERQGWPAEHHANLHCIAAPPAEILKYACEALVRLTMATGAPMKEKMPERVVLLVRRDIASLISPVGVSAVRHSSDEWVEYGAVSQGKGSC